MGEPPPPSPSFPPLLPSPGGAGGALRVPRLTAGLPSPPQRHTSELGEQGRAPPPQSVTEQSPLEAFLAAAELADAAFTAGEGRGGVGRRGGAPLPD